MEVVLDARAVLRWCQAALAALAESREEIDALNVYPVPDGDTGTNLYLTMEAAAQAAEAAADGAKATITDVVTAAARGALLGARGNSGVILAQMLRGVADAFSGEAGGADAGVLCDALGRAADQGYEAVAEPVEGTMLTVARAAAEGARAALNADDTERGSVMPAVALAAAEAARSAVLRTPEQLEVLRRAGVVDAGGQGLSVILDAFDTVLTGRRRLPSIRQLAERTVPEVRREQATHHHQGPAYEVMYLLDAADEAVGQLKGELRTLGDSLVVVGGDGLWNVHVHVDDAGRAIEAGIRAGQPRDVRITYLPEQVGHGIPKPAPVRAVVAFAAGDGLASLFESAGATVVRTSVGHRPSTAEMLEAIRRPGAGDVVLLPNERDGVPVAEAAAAEARSEGIRVAVIPTHAQVQGLAALAVHEPGRGFDADVVAMTTAAGHTRHGAVTIAAREAVTSAGVCQPGDVLGVIEGDFAIIGADVGTVAIDVVSRMLSAGGELVTLVTGDGAADGLADSVAAVVRGMRPDADTVIYAGGQPRYPLLIGVE
ncbi:MAG TPA: DAK2 domain-containing protein [Jiangellaceae bacterium]